MELIVDRNRVRVTDSDLLGVGGEARVYRFRDLALKIFHDDATQSPAMRRARFDKLRAFPSGLPDAVIGPRSIVTDTKDEPVGYAMRVVEGAVDAIRLGQRKFRTGLVPNDTVMRFFREVHRVLLALHQAGVVVGDLNDGNVLFGGTMRGGAVGADSAAWLIDADSMQYGGRPCLVAHERFLDPRLYGEILTCTPRFSHGTDWYAFAVMLFSSLLYVHPYGGVHASFPTLLRRAEARWSVLRSDVVYPRSATPFQTLPDDLLGWFEAIFDRDARDVFPLRLLDARFTRCGCGVEHARKSCPVCTLHKAVPAALGRLVAREIVRTTGRVVLATMQGALRYLVEENGVLRREDGSVVTREPLGAAARCAISARSTLIARRTSSSPIDAAIERIVDGVVVERARTVCFAGEPVLEASALGHHRIDKGHLVDGALGARLGSVIEGQTWFRAGEQLGFGFYRAGLLAFHFLVQRGRAGTRDVALPILRGRIVDVAAAFDEKHVAYSLALDDRGVRTHHLFVIASDGRVLAHASGPPELRMLASIHGKAIANGRVLTATDDGVLSLTIDPTRKTIVEGTLFTEAKPWVSAASELLPGPSGSLYVVTAQAITHLEA